jgi:hypothetical protein
MLSRHVSVARATMDPPWDGARAARILERAVEGRRQSQKRPLGWLLVLAGASLAATLFARRISPPGGDSPGTGPTYDQHPAVVSTPSDSLDAGKQRG